MHAQLSMIAHHPSSVCEAERETVPSAGQTPERGALVDAREHKGDSEEAPAQDRSTPLDFGRPGMISASKPSDI